jgi:transcriptional regulator with XRE-family HTH domain
MQIYADLHEMSYQYKIIYMAGLNLAKILEKKKITKYGFAKLLGMPVPSVFRYFRANYDPKLSTLEKWAKVLNVKVRDLIEE